MLPCLRPSSPPATSNLHPLSPPLQASSTDATPRSSAQPSPTVNLTLEYNLAVQTSSYGEIWKKFHPDNSSYRDIDLERGEGDEEEERLTEVLQPNRECVQEALRHARSNTLNCLVSEYFDQSEHTSQLCVHLHNSVHQARSLYAPIHKLLDLLPLESDSSSLSESQCDWAFNIFLEFDQLNNPFPPSDSHNFHNMRRCFSQLKQQLDHRLGKSKSKSKVCLPRHVTTGSAICLIGTVVCVTISAAVIATHVFIALVACPILPAFFPTKITKKELAHRQQLDAVARNIFVLHNELDTIDRLVARLHTEVESDKLLIRLGLERGKERHPIQEVVKQLHKNHLKIQGQLTDLEEHICICFAAINRARSLLLQEILLHQTNHS